MLAGVSPDYYARLEQGRAVNVSDQVVNAVAAALLLDDLERAHLSALLREQPAGSGGPVRVRREVRTMVDALGPVPAMVHNPEFDVLATNVLARALIHDFDAAPDAERNLLRWVFTDPRARQVYPDWAEVATGLVASLRLSIRSGSLIDELSAASPEFTRFWADHQVRRHSQGPKRFHNAVVGDLTLNFETMLLADGSGLALTVYTADPGSPSAQRLAELWATVS